MVAERFSLRVVHFGHEFNASSFEVKQATNIANTNAVRLLDHSHLSHNADVFDSYEK